MCEVFSDTQLMERKGRHSNTKLVAAIKDIIFEKQQRSSVAPLNALVVLTHPPRTVLELVCDH